MALGLPGFRIGSPCVQPSANFLPGQVLTGLPVRCPRGQCLLFEALSGFLAFDVLRYSARLSMGVDGLGADEAAFEIGVDDAGGRALSGRGAALRRHANPADGREAADQRTIDLSIAG